MPHPEGHKRRIKRMARLSEVLDLSPTLKRQGIRDGDKQMAIYKKWGEVVGDAVSRNTQPIRFSHGILTVAVSSAAWLHNLSMMKPQILHNLGQSFGKDMVLDIRFKTADFDLGKLKAS